MNESDLNDTQLHSEHHLLLLLLFVVILLIKFGDTTYGV